MKKLTTLLLTSITLYANAFQLPYVTLHSCDPTETYSVSWINGGESPNDYGIKGCAKDYIFFDQSTLFSSKNQLCKNYPINCTITIYIGKIGDENKTPVAAVNINPQTMKLVDVRQYGYYEGFKVFANKCKNTIDVVAPGTIAEDNNC